MLQSENRRLLSCILIVVSWHCMSSSFVPASLVHSVHFYDHDEALIRRLRGVINAGLQLGNSVLIVATEDHRKQLTRELEKWHVNVRTAIRDGHLFMFDAAEALALFMRDGRPNRNRFLESIGRFIEDAKQASHSPHQGLTVFGEMVAVLWLRGERDAALELERMWNELLERGGFHLHCAYPRNVAGEQESAVEICGLHSHVVMSRA